MIYYVQVINLIEAYAIKANLLLIEYYRVPDYTLEI